MDAGSYGAAGDVLNFLILCFHSRRCIFLATAADLRPAAAGKAFEERYVDKQRLQTLKGFILCFSGN